MLLLAPGAMLAQQTMRWYRIPEVTIYGKRPMKEIGVQKTQMDSVVLKENIALSMADVLTFNSSIFVKSGTTVFIRFIAQIVRTKQRNTRIMKRTGK